MRDDFTDRGAYPHLKKKGVARLFSVSEIRSFFKRYIVFILFLELIVFLACWLYQLGLVGEDRYGLVSRTFPWKAFFLLAFLIPLSVTFFLGLIVKAFNLFFFGARDSLLEEEKPDPDKLDKKEGLNLFQFPFLFMLLLLILACGLIYRAEEVLYFLDYAGTAFFDLIKFLGVFVLICGTAAGILWMFMAYRLKKQALEYHYKTEVLKCLPLSLKENPDYKPEALLFMDPSSVAPPAMERSDRQSEEKGL